MVTNHLTMKNLILLFSTILFAFAGQAQNGVYVEGNLNNNPDIPVPIIFEINTEPAVTFTAMATEDGDIALQFIELPSSDWTMITASFVDCNGVLNTTTQYNEVDWPLVDIYWELYYCSTPPIYGCTDPSAINYNPDADYDDGSCEYESPTNDLCADATELLPGIITINNTGASQNEGIWGECWGFGQGEGEQSSIWYTFTTPEDPALIEIFATADGTGTLTDTQFGIFEECGGEMIYCDGNSSDGLFSGFYFDCGELETSTTYILMIDGWNGDAGTCLLTYDYSTDCSVEVYGCTDPEALNYNPDATVDDGSCTYETDCNGIPLEVVFDSNGALNGWWVLTDTETGDYVAMDTIASNVEFYDLCLEDGCYNFYVNVEGTPNGWGVISIMGEDGMIMSGTVQAGEFEFEFTVGSGCDGEEIYGCTDPAAANYDPNATVDDGSCFYIDSCQVVFDFYPTGCASAEFQVFNPYTGEPIFGTWSVNDMVIQTFDAFFNFEAEEPGDYVICWEGWDPNCEEGYVFCTDYFVGEDCFYECPDLYLETDSSTCHVWLSLDEIPDDTEVTWYFGDGEMEVGGAIADHTYDGPGLYTACAVYDIEGCDYEEQCIDVYTYGCGEDVYGCTDQNAINYNPNANINDGSCEYADLNEYQVSCSSWELFVNTSITQNILWSVNGEIVQEGGWSYYFVPEEAGEYVVCFEAINPFTGDYIMECIDLFASPDCFGTCPELYYETGDCLAYVGLTNIPDTSSIFWSIWDPAGNGSEFIGGTDVVIDLEEPGTYSICAFYGSFSCDFNEYCIDIESWDCGEDIYGCTDPNAINYNPEATIDDGTCEYESDCDGYESVLLINNSGQATGVWMLSQGDAVLYSGQIGADFTDDWFCLEDGCYTLTFAVIPGDLDIDGFFTFWVGDEIGGNDWLLAGNSSFTIEVGDGCEDLEVYGCTDPAAANYNPEATVDDGSCYYEFDCDISFTVTPDSTGENTIWITPSINLWDAESVLWTFGDGSSSTELFPQHTYEGDGPYVLCLSATIINPDGGFCEATFCVELDGSMIDGSGFQSSGFQINVIDASDVTGVDELVSGNAFDLWPNPAKDIIEIKADLNDSEPVQATIFDLRGKALEQWNVIPVQNQIYQRIDISDLPSGMYFLNLRNDIGSTTVRFVVSQ